MSVLVVRDNSICGWILTKRGTMVDIVSCWLLMPRTS